MFYIHQSNSMESLKNWLLEIIEKKAPDSVLANEIILVQNPGMAQWLQQQIALSSGIAAALRFPLPATFIWQLFQQLLSGVPEVSAYGKESMTWKLMHLLPQKLDEPAFEALRHYLLPEVTNREDDNDLQITEQTRLYQLASKIADTFDQYLVYRPDWIKAWERGENLPAITREHPWQPLLWQSLTEYTADRQQSHWHRANLFESLLTRLQQLPAEKKKMLPHRLFVFGLSTLPPAYLEVLKSLGGNTDVHLMVHNPSRMYWGDATNPRYQRPDTQGELQFTSTFHEEENNSLLSSMGKMGRDYHVMLSELEAIEEERFHDPLSRHPASLLSHIQSQVFDFTEPDIKIPVPEQDNSLTINSCHSALREAEILHDYLLELFEKDDTLTPRDIIVMAPDVELYSPAIQAVFSSVPSGRYIPFSISDLNSRREHPLLEALLAILVCHRERCTVTEVLSILEVPAIMRRFGIKPDEFPVIESWIKESGIRWGLDASLQESRGLPAHYQNTWQFGMDRLLLGYAMEGEDILYDGKRPSQHIEGLEASLCGLFIDFLKALKSVSHSLEPGRTSKQWSLLLHEILDTFFQPDPDEESVMQMVRDTLATLCEQTEMADNGFILSHAVMMEWLTERLEQSGSNQRFLNGKVNVCTLMPMRSIPFKVICLLGMNDGAYPRSIPPGSFDLAAQFPRRGDRSRRDDDRYLFLEALLAAKQTLYISYNGRCITDNSVRVPSVLVSELKEYCMRNFIHPQPCSWVNEHPLQPYSPEYFTGSKKLFSYAKEWVLSSDAPAPEQQTPTFIHTPLKQKELPEELAIEDLQRFYRHPCKHFFQNRLGISFEPPESIPEEDEPFSVFPLDRYHIESALLENHLHNTPSRHSLDLARASGQIPFGHFGTIAMQEMETRMRGFAEEIKPLLNKKPHEQEIQLELENTCINGWIKNIHENCLIRYRPGKRGNRLLVSSLIEHLAWCASCKTAGETRVFHLSENREKTRTVPILLRPVPRIQSIEAIETLISIYHQGLMEPLPFFPDISVPWIMETVKNGDDETKQEQAGKKMVKAFEDAVEHDAYMQRIWPAMNEELLVKMKNTASTILQTLVTYGT